MRHEDEVIVRGQSPRDFGPGRWRDVQRRNLIFKGRNVCVDLGECLGLRPVYLNQVSVGLHQVSIMHPGPDYGSFRVRPGAADIRCRLRV